MESTTSLARQGEKSVSESEIVANMPPMASIGPRIKRLRESVRGRTQAEFGLMLGVTRGAVNNWERGQGISRSNLSLISQRLGVTTDWLVNGPDEGPIPFVDKPAPPQIEGVLAASIDEVLRMVGVPLDKAAALVAMLQQVAAASPPGFPGLSQEETARMIVRRLADKILAN